MSNLIIPAKHQSAPKEHWADKEIKKAAEEIDAGRYVPEIGSDPEADELIANMGIALGMGSTGAAVGMQPALEDFRRTQELDALGRHPRVIEALEKMKEEIYEPDDPVKALERTWMLRELTAASMGGQKWDGQGRWQGTEAMEMRQGEVLTPYEFHKRLEKVIGRKRVFLSPHVVKASEASKSGRVGLYVRNPEWKGDKYRYLASPRVEAESLRLRGMHEMKRGQAMRKAGKHPEANLAFKKAQELGEAAGSLFMQATVEDALKPPELLRVGALQWPCGTEWMIMDFNEWGVVYKARFLGWRTALLTMIRSKIITEAEAHKAFPVGSGPAAEWYQEQLFMMRAVEGTVQ